MALSSPALVFWLGGLVAWTYDRGGISRRAQPPGTRLWPLTLERTATT